jgi:hypothetical protein
VNSIENQERVNQEILSYLSRNPEHCFSLEEIADWWLMQKKVTDVAEEVKRCLRQLCDEEFVVVRSAEKARGCCYQINSFKRTQIPQRMNPAKM